MMTKVTSLPAGVLGAYLCLAAVPPGEMVVETNRVEFRRGSLTGGHHHRTRSRLLDGFQTLFTVLDHWSNGSRLLFHLHIRCPAHPGI